MKNISDVIEKCGGDLEIAYRFKLHQQTVKRWAVRGIPKKYWKMLPELSGNRISEQLIKRLHTNAI